jgi:hypothetical protein
MDWKSTIADLHQYGDVTSPLEKIELHTNEYLPSGRECVPPQPAQAAVGS